MISQSINLIRRQKNIKLISTNTSRTICNLKTLQEALQMQRDRATCNKYEISHWKRPPCDGRTDGWTHDDSIYRASI